MLNKPHKSYCRGLYCPAIRLAAEHGQRLSNQNKHDKLQI